MTLNNNNNDGSFRIWQVANNYLEASAKIPWPVT